MISPRLKKHGAVWTIHTLLGIWMIISLFPPLMLVAASLNRTALFRSPLDLLMFRNFSTENFSQAFVRGDFWFFFTNSVIISTSAVVITLVVCVPLAYGLTKIVNRRVKRDQIAV